MIREDGILDSSLDGKMDGRRRSVLIFPSQGKRRNSTIMRKSWPVDQQVRKGVQIPILKEQEKSKYSYLNKKSYSLQIQHFAPSIIV